MGKMLTKIIWVLLLTCLLLGVPRLSGMVADLFDYHHIDPEGAYAWISVHHIVQALIFLVIIAVTIWFKPINFGFNWGNKEIGKKYLLKFALIFGAGSLVNHVLVIVLNNFQPFFYPLTATNIAGQLGFQLLLSGPSEELIFRAFAITTLALVLKGRVFKGKVSLANIIAAIIFGLAHVSFSFAPFELRYSLYQVILSVGLGFFYGDCYEKTGSMYYPMMMHSISNIIMVGFTILGTVIFA